MAFSVINENAKNVLFHSGLSSQDKRAASLSILYLGLNFPDSIRRQQRRLHRNGEAGTILEDRWQLRRLNFQLRTDQVLRDKEVYVHV